MKKFLIVMIFTIILYSKVYGYSKNFEYMISTMNIEPKTEHGYQLNEEIYNAYHQFVYGNPLMISSTQRWKDVADGRWTKNGGIWNGAGTRGEYWVLGYNLSEEYVHNHQFPVDAEPPTPPTEWRYVPLQDATASWNDTQLYLHEEQKEYMQNTKLTRNNMMYDITAVDIGLDKAKVENYATWKTNGNIYTRRYDKNNKEWAANFIVPPMAADAKLTSKLYFPEGKCYTIGKEEESISIPVEFGTEMTQLSDYAKAEHVKCIRAELISNEKTCDIVEKEKAIKVEKNGCIVIEKSEYPNQGTIELEISCQSLLLTEFIVDGALTDVNTQIIQITIEGVEESQENIVKKEDYNKKEDAIPPYINDIDLGREENGKIVKLKKAKKTNSEFICAGQVLALNVEAFNTDYITLEFSGDSSIMTFDDLTKRFEWDEPRERGIATRYARLSRFQDIYGGKIRIDPYQTVDNKTYFRFSYVIPYRTKQTLHSWSTLREVSRDAFVIDETQLFSRIKKPYWVVVKAYSNEGVRTKSVSLDVFERWDTLYNRDISAYVK